VLNSLDLFSRLAPGASIVPSADTDSVARFIERIRAGMTAAARSQSSLHGWRVQRLFMEMVVSLGGVLLIKEEDSGDLYFRGDKPKVPDFRIVLTGNSRLLVEVKNHWSAREVSDFSISLGELSGLKTYASLMGDAGLRLAVYWSRWNLWSLFHPDRLTIAAGRARISMSEALKANEMSDLGDMMIATQFPIRLNIPATQSAPGDPRRGVEVRLGKPRWTCAGRLLRRKIERQLAMFLMMYGPWPVEDRIHISKGRVRSITVDAAPEMPRENQSFESLSFLSALYSSYFNEATLSDSSSVRALATSSNPRRLGSLLPMNYRSDSLPITRFVVKPSLEDKQQQ
jgi:hypothetical protein